jgi:FKBP-type peptidyl-prolyl cis-trans isomerase
MMRKMTWFAPALILVLAGCNKEESSTSSTTQSSEATATTTTPTPATGDATNPASDRPGEVVTGSGLRYTDVVVGPGTEARSGNMVTVHYTGTLTDGTPFDSSIGKAPLSFTIDGSTPFNVIEGWDEGVKGMKVGGKRHLVIPPNLGYGSQGTGPIPPNSTLVFDIELLEVK